MKLRITFVAECVVEGAKITKADLVQSCVEWLYDMDEVFSDGLADYLPEECEFDRFEMTIDEVNVK